ncbi:MAG: family permease [Chloroflexi bacterium]|nr:family permease [Chloroflexota bacterium]
MMQEVRVDEARLEALREAGKAWPDAGDLPPPRAAVSSDLVMVKEVRGTLPGDKYVRVVRTGKGAFRAAGPGAVRATAAVPRALDPIGRLTFAAKEWIVGGPLANEQASHERLSKVKALAVLSSDAVSSVAYATGAMLSVLLLAGAASFHVSLGIGAAIAALFAIVVLSYRQTVKAYPRGGGSYIVASDNLGSLFGLIAGSSLMIDYVLTVAVSITQGVANLVSLAPGLAPYTLIFDLGALALLLFGNLRGIRESGTLFMLPSYLFIFFVYLMIVVGTVHFFANGMHVMAPHYLPGVMPVHATESLGLFLILRAFAGGCTALTGVEAISDGVPAFKPPEWRNARTTLTTLGILAITMFTGITLLVHAYGLVPNAGDNVPTLISQLNSTTLGNGIGFYYGQIVTALILLLAANTAYSDFPRLAFFMARDNFLPHQFTHRGDRLSYSNGILILTALAAVLVFRYWSDTSQLFNLYVIGVFASFTLSQSGMVRRWWTRREEHWRKGMLISGLGAIVTFVVLCITGYTKFTSGAWLVVVLVPLMVTAFFRIRAHYRRSGEQLQPRWTPTPASLHHTIVVAGFDESAALSRSLAYVRILRATHIVVIGPAEMEPASVDLPATCQLEYLPSTGVSMSSALLRAVKRLPVAGTGELITVVLPAPKRLPWSLPAQWRLRRVLLRHHGVAVAQVAAGLNEATVATRHTALVSVAVLNQAALEALAYCRSLLTGRVLAVHVAAEDDRGEQAKREWEAWGNHLPLVSIDSPYRAIVALLYAYVEALSERDGGETITMALPLVLAPGVLSRILHNHTANRLRRLLLKRPNTVVISIPHRLA